MSNIPYWSSVACAFTVAVAKNNYTILVPLTMGILPRIVDSVKEIWPDFTKDADHGYMADSEGEFIQGKWKDECKGKNKDETQTQESVSPIREGNYRATGPWYTSLIVEGTRAVIKDSSVSHDTKIEIGNFGKSDPDIAETTGHNFYNVKLTTDNVGVDVVEHGVVSEDGAKITMKGTGGISVLEWITQEEADALEAEGDPIEAPPYPYKIQPENLGKLLWITGPPGVGKSTTAQLLSRDEGYVYYEGDCFHACKNPYIPSDVPEPSLAQFQQRNLIGEGLEARKKAIQKTDAVFKDIVAGEDYDIEVMHEYCGMMCEDIKKERERIGGDWVIAQTALKREMRDFIRSRLGPDLIFVVLNIEDEDFERRLSKRHEEDESPLQLLMAIKKNCDPAGEDEENTIEIMVTDDMTKEELVNKIIQNLFIYLMSRILGVTVSTLEKGLP